MVRKIFACILVALFAATGATAAEIHTASAKGNLARVKALVNAKPALVNAKDSDGATPLHHAVAKGRIEVVKFLIAKKANVNAVKKDGVTPLHIAAALGEKEIAEILIKANANVTATDKKGRTPVSIAQDKNDSAMIAILSAHSVPNTSSAVIPPAPKASEPTTPSVAANSKDIVSIATEFVDQVSSGQYDKAEEKFDVTMKSALPASQLKAVWTSATLQAGPFVKVAGTRRANVQGGDVVYVTCQFQKTSADIQIAFNASKQISGLYVVPPSGAK